MEPERRIEKLLRAFARKRREQSGDPMELRPAARQRLQSEISRRAAGGKSAGGFFANFLAMFRPRLALVAMAVAIIAVGAFLLVPGVHEKSELTLSMNSSAGREMPVESAPPPQTLAPAVAPVVAPPAVTAVAPKTAAKDYDVNNPGVAAEQPAVEAGEARGNRGTSLADNEKSKRTATQSAGLAPPTAGAAGVIVASTPPAGTPATHGDQFKPTAPAANASSMAGTFDRLIQPPPPVVTNTMNVAGAAIAARSSDVPSRPELKADATAPATLNAETYANLAKNDNLNTAPIASQAFNRLDAARKQLPTLGIARVTTSAPVLASFRVEQQGDQMRVVDADGSVYTGAVQWAQQELTQNANNANVNLPPKNTQFANQVTRNVQQLQAAQNYYFRVAGTNRNLRENVVFSGNLIPFTNAPGSQFNGFGGGGGGGGAVAQKVPEQAPVQALLSNSRIAGTAVIGNQKEIEVNATPTN